MTPQELKDLAHLRHARDCIDGDHAQLVDVAEMSRTDLMSTAPCSPPVCRGACAALRGCA